MGNIVDFARVYGFISQGTTTLDEHIYLRVLLRLGCDHLRKIIVLLRFCLNIFDIPPTPPLELVGTIPKEYKWLTLYKVSSISKWLLDRSLKFATIVCISWPCTVCNITWMSPRTIYSKIYFHWIEMFFFARIWQICIHIYMYTVLYKRLLTFKRGKVAIKIWVLNGLS